MDPSRHSGKQTSTRRRFRLSDFAASYWQKNTEATGNDVTSALSATPSLTSLPSAELEQLTVSDRAACLTCALQFATFHEQRIHFKTDWHKYNAQRKVHGRPTITEDDFDGLSDLGSVGSLSGSEAGSDDDEPGANHVLPQPAVQHAEKLEFRHPSGDGTFIVLYKASLPDSATLPSLGERGAWGVVMTGGGHFCAAMWDVKGEMIRHKTFHRYTSRRKQGGSQAAADKSRGGGSRIKSAGATLRRYGEQSLQKEVQDLLRSWYKELADAQCIYIRAGRREKWDLLLGWDGSPLKKAMEEDRLRNVPFPTRRATLKETTRVYEELCQFTVSSTSLVKAVDAKAKVSEATSKAARSGIRKEADHSASKSKEKGTDHLKKREEKRPPKVLEPIAVDGDEPALDPKLVAAVGACLNNLTDDLFDMLHTDSSLGLSVFGKRFFREDGRFEKLEGEIGLVGVAAVCGAADTVERLMEEGVSPCTGISPYLSTKSKAVRNRLRTFWAKHPDLYDYAQAGIPSPLTAADLEAQAERERAKRRKDKQKKKDKALERAEAVKPPEQRAREMRAAAAEARMLGNRCGACRKSLSGIAPFERLAFKYCSTACVSNHRKILSQM